MLMEIKLNKLIKMWRRRMKTVYLKIDEAIRFAGGRRYENREGELLGRT
jgi:hypothetical protein